MSLEEKKTLHDKTNLERIHERKKTTRKIKKVLERPRETGYEQDAEMVLEDAESQKKWKQLNARSNSTWVISGLCE